MGFGLFKNRREEEMEMRSAKLRFFSSPLLPILLPQFKKCPIRQIAEYIPIAVWNSHELFTMATNGFPRKYS